MHLFAHHMVELFSSSESFKAKVLTLLCSRLACILLFFAFKVRLNYSNYSSCTACLLTLLSSCLFPWPVVCSVHLSVCFSVNHPICLFPVHLHASSSICVFLYPFVSLFLSLCFSLSICLSVFLSICLSTVHPSACSRTRLPTTVLLPYIGRRALHNT